MNYKQLEEAIRNVWVFPSSGLDTGQVVFANQDGVSPAPGPCILISIGGAEHRGLDQVTQDFDAARPAGKEIVYTVQGLREITVRLEAFSPGTVERDAQATCRALLEQVQASLSLPPIRMGLNALSIGVRYEGDVQWLPGIQKAGWEGRAFLDARFYVPATATAAIGYIARVNGTLKVTGDGEEVDQPYTAKLT